jgi:hypothetical protein
VNIQTFCAAWPRIPRQHMKYKWRFHFHIYMYEDSLHSQLRQMSWPLFSGSSNYPSKPALSCFRFAGFTTVCWKILKQFFKQKCTLLGPLDHEEVGTTIPWNLRKYPVTHCHLTKD